MRGLVSLTYSKKGFLDYASVVHLPKLADWDTTVRDKPRPEVPAGQRYFLPGPHR